MRHLQNGRVVLHDGAAALRFYERCQCIEELFTASCGQQLMIGVRVRKVHILLGTVGLAPQVNAHLRLLKEVAGERLFFSLDRFTGNRQPPALHREFGRDAK